MVDPALKADVHRVMTLVEDQILAACREQEILRAAPRELSADQSAVLVALQQLLAQACAERPRVLAVLAALSHPLLSGPVKELKKALAHFQKSGSVEAFLDGCEAVGQKYAPVTKNDGASVQESRRPLRREELRLVCFEYLS